MTPRKIITDYVYPPIPIREFDWCAYYDDIGPEGPRGWGATEQEAVRDLLDEGSGMIHPLMLSRWRRDALSVVTDPHSPASLRKWAWLFLKQHGVR